MYQKTIALLFLFSSLVCFFPSVVGAEKNYSLLFVNSQEAEPYTSMKEMILFHLEQAGYIAGKNLKISYWSIGNAKGRAMRVWRTEKIEKYDAVYLGGTIAVKYFKEFTYDNLKYNFIFGSVTNPIELGLIDQFNAPPKANFTGISYPVRVASRLRFIQTILPEVKNVGYIYADMPQSHSYLKELKTTLTSTEFSRMRFHFREVEFVPGPSGHIRMAKLAKQYVKELSSKVDLFLSPNDQMGAEKEYVATVTENSDKPLIGLAKKDVMEWGAPISFYPSTYYAAKQISEMLIKQFEGVDFSTILPQTPEPEIAINMKLAARYNFFLPDRLVEQAGENIIW